MIDTIETGRAARLRDVERAGRLRNLLTIAEIGTFESARFCRYTLRDEAQALRHMRSARFYGRLYDKVCLLQARARGEAL